MEVLLQAEMSDLHVRSSVMGSTPQERENCLYLELISDVVTCR